jgi:GH15 family glucan-1,4-alpha-glucosidase
MHRPAWTAPAAGAADSPPIADYALIGDCHSAALVSREGSIDWCCLPRFDSDSCFARLLDRRRGGHFAIAPLGRWRIRREYLGDSLVLATHFEGESGRVRLLDFFAMRVGGREHPRRELVRIVEALEGSARVRVRFSPRLDYGDVEPWIYRCAPHAHVAVGSNTALLVSGDIALAPDGKHDLGVEFELRAGQRAHLAMQFLPPERLDEAPPRAHDRAAIDAHLQETLAWWRAWAGKLTGPGGRPGASALRSAITLKALTFAPTGAIVAAPTTSLPEHAGGERNWDYRYSWIRDSVFTVRALASLGCIEEADGFRRFVQRSAAGNAADLQVVYAVDGKRRLTEVRLDHLEGWRGSRPVRIGNAAHRQFQGDLYGLLLELAWRWSERGNVPSAVDWDFLAAIVECALERWNAPDHGIWEIRTAPRHFVHSKAMCWAALNRGLMLAQAHGLPAPLERWHRAREAIRATVLAEGVDRARGVFVGSFGGRELDAALLLLPEVGFVAYDDPLMRRTAAAVAQELDRDGLILRYRRDDGLAGEEGVFLPCSFWLVECLARQGEVAEARRRFERACACANDLGLFAEEFAPARGEMLGNFPQGLTHLAHISAALALQWAEERQAGARSGARAEALTRP